MTSPLVATLDALVKDEPAVLVTVGEVRGSAPREAGARMLVTVDGIVGTIGGGQLEWKAIGAARRLLQESGAPRVLDLPLGPLLQQCCGGHVTLTLEPVTSLDRAHVQDLRDREQAGRPVVAVFGAGHVGRAVVSAVAPLPCRIVWADPRTDLLAAAPPGVVPGGMEVAGLPAGSFLLIMTHSHPLDLDLVEAALRRDDLAWVGLIGSDSKRRRFEGQLRARGIARDRIDRLVCPIGIRGILGKEPAVIATAVAAQLLIAFEAQGARNALARSVA